MPKKLTKILGELLKVARYAMKHAIKTGIGISEETYQHSDESPAFGSGQGSGASAQGWGKLVSVLRYSQYVWTWMQICRPIETIQRNNRNVRVCGWQ
jgi:hypothetical protein